MKRSARSFLRPAFALFAIGSAHCQPTDVVIAQIPESTDGGDGGEHDHHAMPCTSAADCRESDFCDKHACKDALGECRPRPIFCDSSASFVCGCDGVTYWNDCLRKAGGVAAGVPGECEENVATCDGPTDETCPAFGASCAHLFAGGGPLGPCPFDEPGRCWVLPATCPPPSGGQAWGVCSDPHAGCTDMCSAIRTEVPFRSLPSGACK